MDKENGKSSEGNSSSNKLSNQSDPASLLDAASLFGAYWPRGDAAAAANLFAAGGGFGMPPHPAAAAAAAASGMPFGLMPPSSPGGRGAMPNFPTSSVAAAYSNAYTNTLSVAASQAASLGIPAASAAWWSMASHLAAQDYLARLQASGLNFPSLGDPYASLAGLPSLSSGSSHHQAQTKSKNSSKGGSKSHAKDKSSPFSLHHQQQQQRSSSSPSLKVSSSPGPNAGKSPKNSALGLTIHSAGGARYQQEKRSSKGSSSSSSSASASAGMNDMTYNMKQLEKLKNSGNNVSISSSSEGKMPMQSSSTSGIFSSPMNMVSGSDKGAVTSAVSCASTVSSVGLPSSILSDPNSILGGVRLPPDTEIIKYTSSIVGPKVPGTTNRGRKKTISLDPPLVSVHPSSSLERSNKRLKLNESLDDHQQLNSHDRIEMIKLPPTNGSPSGISGSPYSSNNGGESAGEAPLNLSLKSSAPPSTCSTNPSLNSLSNMSANIGMDRVSRRKPGPKPRRVIPSGSQHPPPAPSSSLLQMFASADSPRPPSRNEGSDGGSSTSSTSAPPTNAGGSSSSNHKEGRPRNLGRGVSKPKKNTVASLLAQSRALGIKPMPMLDPNTSMNQQLSFLKSNILAAQQYINEAGGDEKMFNKLLQEKFKGTLSDSSTVDASTDSDNMSDSNHTDSEMEVELPVKKQKQYDERALRVPLELGWKRETVIRGLTKTGGLKGDVTYSAPDCSNKFKQMSDVTQYLESQNIPELSRDNFTFSCRVILGNYLQPVPPEMAMDGEFVQLTEEDVTKRLEELKSAMRTNLSVEQRIELARKQQAVRAAARLDREQARIAKEIERSERQEAARRDREIRSQQMMEAKRKRQEEMERQKQEEQQRKQQERELKRQQASMIKEQMYIQEISKQQEMLYTVELERERRRQHMALVKSLESRRKLEEREKKKQQLLAEKQANKEKKMEQRRLEMEILNELRKPCEDLELDQKPMPELERIPGLKLPGQAFGNVLMVFEFLHNFGETLGFDMDSLPTLDSLQQALMPNEHSFEAEEELFSIMTHLLVCAVEDPGIPNPARHTTILGQSLRQADITHVNLSEILRIYLYANATGEVKALTGVHFEREREKRIADHHQNDDEMQVTQQGKNSQYYELLHNNETWKLSNMLKDKPFMALSPTRKSEILAYICNELLQNKAVIRQIEASLEQVVQLKKEKWLLDNKIRKLKMLHGKKVRSEAVEKVQKTGDMDISESAVDSPSLHKEDLLDDEENEMSDNESLATQPEEEEDAKLSGEELGKKLEKLLKTSESQLQALNISTQQLRATCFGQDRYWRRYWHFPKAGGIYVEAMESADPELLHQLTEEDSKTQDIIETTPYGDFHSDQDDKETNYAEEGQYNSIYNSAKEEYNEENEHRKTPNRLDGLENGSNTLDRDENNLLELQKSVDDVVQNLEKERHAKEQEMKMEVKTEEEPLRNRKFNLFEKLGQCMERENKTEEDLRADVKAEVKEELKNEILNELKNDIKTESKEEEEHKSEAESKWFSVLSREGTCEEVHLTAGNKWDNGAVTRDNVTELKIPVFPHPNSGGSYSNVDNCDNLPPLLITAEESVQLEYIKKHGMPKSCPKKSVPVEKRYGWWKVSKTEELKEILDNLHVRGIRERELKRNFNSIMQAMYPTERIHIEEGNKELTELSTEHMDDVMFMEGGAPYPDQKDAWNKAIAERVDASLLEQVEALEEKVANASMQVKGWKPPSREGPPTLPEEMMNTIRERLASLEQNIERRYLKPPLGVNTGDPNLAAIAQETTGTSSTSSQPPTPGPDDIPKGLATWREALNRSQTSAQLAMCQYSLEASIAWDKSIMKANCQFCHSGDNEDKLLLCDGCDRGYHTYCFKPMMENIPEGDWYCHECMNKATGERNCIVCGKKQAISGTKLVLCDLCPRAYHLDCLQPPITKIPRGKWYCLNCISRKPQKKVKKNNNKTPKENETSEHPPPSPAPSHSSVATNEDQSTTTNCNQSDISNSSLCNTMSPSSQTPKKERVSKKLIKELVPCKAILEDLECHDDAWPFLLPVNTKQFPTYRKIIKTPMDLSTIKKRLQDMHYKSREEFTADVRQIFNNCEIFNEDDSPVGKAGHMMRQFFEARWNEMCLNHS
ncbi:bromodomain adjacent to zinc finger domain protein 2B isoform X2 [Harmonia axyridis]|uniref:bromodomain adjacent to zinc finger domain protein 2B isoform X2 n=1 Tax=Harmonia axyridis TaxID=115357 RepID=UPI001E276B82|nr:bromodomain adjacent to zinc finger domain protein 2B isoform X2 [Harmonia axyridis]